MSECPLDVSDSEDHARFRDVLAAAGYTDKALVEKFGPVRLPNRAGPESPYFVHLTREGTVLDTLLRLFILGVPVTPEAAGRALSPVPLERWFQAGLLRGCGETLVGAVRILPFRGLLLASDQAEGLDPLLEPEQVMGVTASTMMLADFAVRRQVGSALDLGTGSGAQAFLASRHSAHVVATDSTGRALRFARFNALLNGIKGIEFLQGGLFQPVEGRKFDLVVSNPPFAITPSRRYAYRDGGMGLDRFAEHLVRTAPGFLNGGGFCQICCDWVHLAGQDWQERLAGWVEGSGCDAWIMRLESFQPADYARVWVRDTEHADLAEAARLYGEFVAYYEREHVETISNGLVALRRNPGARNWLRIEDGPDAHTLFFGEHVLLGFVLRDYLERTTDEALLAERLRVAPAARLDQRCECQAGGWRPVSASIRLARGLEYGGNMDLRLSGLVGRCDGQRALSELIAELAARAGASVEKITPNCVALLRQLIERGFVLPEGIAAPEER